MLENHKSFTPFRDMYQAHGSADKNIQLPETLSDEEYLLLCDYLGKRILSLETLQMKLNNSKANKIQSAMSGQKPRKKWLAIIPETDSGAEYTSGDIANHQYFYELMIDDHGLTRGFSARPGYYIELLPASIRDKCMIEVHFPKSEPLLGHVNQTEWIAYRKNYLAAFNSLREFFKLPAISEEEIP